ncbi:MAG TPA: hypothetical protein VIL18_11410 [Longimicrobiales bacterium]
MPNHHRLVRGSASVAVLALLAACADQGPRMPTDPSESPLASVEPVSEKAALTELTRAVALALQDNGLRQRIKNDMRASRIREHKLEFRSYIRGSGGILLNKMAQATGKSRAELLALVESVRPLEFYMPVAEHRARWTGGTDLLVASQLEDTPDEPPAAFDLQGRPVELAYDQAPTTPVLSLVPVETDFSRPLDPDLWENTDDLAGHAIGNYHLKASVATVMPDDAVPLVDCSPEDITCGGGGGGGGTVDPWSLRPTGMYVTYLYISHDFEGILKGDPEFEVHLMAPRTDPNVTESIRCAGEHAPDSRSRFDLNGTVSRAVFMIADSLEQERFKQTFGTSVGMQVVVWEDDDTACVIKVEQDRFKKAVDAVRAAAPLAWAAIQDPTLQTIVKALPGVVTAAVAVANWLKSNDELVGHATFTPTQTSCNGEAGAKTVKASEGSACIKVVSHYQSLYAN